MSLLAGCVLAFAPLSVHAQNPQRITTCGTAAPGAGSSQPYMDANGNLCTSGAGGTSAAPLPTASTQAAGTITLGNTFQTALAASATRRGCLIQNTSSHTMNVYVGLLADATALKSFQVPVGGTFACAAQSGVVVNDAINVTTSTTADTFVAASQ